MASSTAIQVPRDLKRSLDRMKISKRETYADVIERLVEDTLELSEETKRDIQRSLEDHKAGRYQTHEEVGRELGLWRRTR